MITTRALAWVGAVSPRPLTRAGSPGRLAMACATAAGVLAGGGWTCYRLLAGHEGPLPLPREVALWFLAGAAVGFIVGATVGWLADGRRRSASVSRRQVLLAVCWTPAVAVLGWVAALWIALTLPVVHQRTPGAVGAVVAGWTLGALLVGWAVLEIGAAVRRIREAPDSHSPVAGADAPPGVPGGPSPGTMTKNVERLSWTLPVLAVLVLAAGCVDERTVFVEGPLFADPPAAAQGFLGYGESGETEERKPVCGACHVGQNAEWQETAHARAWEDLQASGHAGPSCEGCHSVNDRGNTVTTEQVGYTSTGDARYHDVQCESCHGPGLEHVTNPDATQPLASIKVGVDLTSGCGECHQGVHNPFVEEWSQSRHANESNHAIENASCQSCHEGRGALRAFGVKAEYLEKDGEELVPITCPVCHDPHDATNEGQLRFPIDVRDVNENLCMKCHQRRAVPDPTSTHGPHSPQGPLLLDQDVGWRPPNFEYNDTRIVGTHGTERNPRLCATCHVSRLQVTDATGSFLFNASGHLFKPIPCLDDQGIPTASDDCSVTERSFASCTASGCHGTQVAARSAYLLATSRIASLVEELEDLLAQIPASEFDTTDGVYTTAEGAKFNAELGAITSSAIHNPFLTEALLRASIEQVEEDYGVQPVQPLDLAPRLQQPPSVK